MCLNITEHIRILGKKSVLDMKAALRELPLEDYFSMLWEKKTEQINCEQGMWASCVVMTGRSWGLM